jgi:glycosyltransferase involved in cell wall biosynthesis
MESLDLRGFDLVISSSSSAAHGVHVPDGVHVSYVYNTMRYAWQYDDYMQTYPLPRIVKQMGKPAAWALRNWDRRAAHRAGAIAAISKTVAGRIRERWLVEPECVIWPPAELDQLTIGRGEREGYLVVSRLLPYKRVDAAVKAATERRLSLTVIGDGPDRPRLERLAGPTVRFLGNVGDDIKRCLLRSVIAVIVPGEEDYGLVPLEANACGTPVVGLNRGGVAETQIDGVTGILIPGGDVDAFADAMQAAAISKWDRDLISSLARARGRPAFEAALAAFLERVMSRRSEIANI